MQEFIDLQGSTNIDETQWLAGLRAGDETCYENLVRAYGGRLLRVARRYLDEEEARDAVQEAFIKAFETIQKFRGQASLYTWLHRIVVNMCLMKLRKAAAHREESIDPHLPAFRKDGHRVNPRPAWAIGADEILQVKELRNLVHSSIARLPASYRFVLMLRDIEGFNSEETADVLGISSNAVKIRLHRARLALRELLDPRIVESAR